MSVDKKPPRRRKVNDILGGKAIRVETLTSPYTDASLIDLEAKGIVESFSSMRLYGKPLRHQTREIKMEKYHEYYQTEGLVFGAVNAYADYGVAPGWELVDKETGKGDTEEVEIIRKMMDRIHSYTVSHRVFRELCVFGTVFPELDVVKKQIKRVVFLNPKDMRLALRTNGELDKVFQTKTSDKAKSPEWSGDDLKNLQPITFNELGDDPYGTGIVEPIADLIVKKRNMETDLAKIVHLFGHPWTQVKVGTDAYPASDDTVSSVGTEIKSLKPGDVIVTKHNVEIVVNTPRVPEGLDANYDRLVSNIVVGLQVPPILLPGLKVDYGKTASGTTFSSFILRLVNMQNVVKEWYENTVFPRELEAQGKGYKEVVAMNWRRNLALETLMGVRLADLVDRGVISKAEARANLRAIGFVLQGEGEDDDFDLQLPPQTNIPPQKNGTPTIQKRKVEPPNEGEGDAEELP